MLIHHREEALKIHGYYLDRKKQMICSGLEGTAREYTAQLKKYYNGFDEMLDGNIMAYHEYCDAMNIPDIYGSKENFVKQYPYDTENPDSIISNLYRAYDNAMVMRDYISSESLAYIQLAIFDIKSAKGSDAPLITLQDTVDHLLAFWGCIDENVDDAETRNLIKLGKMVELFGH